MSATVYVTNISKDTSDQAVKDFFSFCGTISSFNITSAEDADTKSAELVFVSPTAVHTACLLNNTQLGSTHISVSAPDAKSPEHGSTAPESNDNDEITQEEKPRSRILAEYLAHGYVIGDAALKRAIDLDHTHGVSQRFLTTLQNLDKKYNATEKAKATDQSYGITQRAGGLFNSLTSYFEKASNTPTGQRIAKFYSESSRQVQDVHTEARRLAEMKKEAHGGSAYKASGLERVFGKEKEPPVAGDTPGTMSSEPTAPTGEKPASVDAPKTG